MNKKIKLPSDSKIFSSHVRFSVMLILYQYTEISLNNLKKLLNITSGNLDHHLKMLENRNYIKKKSKFLDSRFFIFIIVTKEGRNDFNEYIEELETVLKCINNKSNF